MRQVQLSARLAAVMLLVASGMAGGEANAATSQLNVSANVPANCIVDATGTLDFGDYDPVVANKTTDLDKEGTIGMTCTKGATVTVTLGNGANPLEGDGTPTRRMVNTDEEYLTYELYTDNTYGTVWDSTTGAQIQGKGGDDDLVIYGRIPAGQNATAGLYSDTVVATVTF